MRYFVTAISPTPGVGYSAIRMRHLTLIAAAQSVVSRLHSRAAISSGLVGYQTGLRSIRVVAGSRRTFKSRAVSSVDRVDAVTVAEVAITLQLNHEVVCHLVEIGVLERTAGGVMSRESVMAFRDQYANAQLYRAALGCTNAEVHDRLAAIGVSACFGLRGTNIVVEREATRRALGLEYDPDDPRVAGHDLWEEFRAMASSRCSAFILPPTVPDVGAKIRTATRKVALDIAVDRAAGTISLGFDLHPTLTGRRWKLFERNEVDVRKALGFMDWKRSGDGSGWRLSFKAQSADDLEQAVEALNRMHRFFK